MFKVSGPIKSGLTYGRTSRYSCSGDLGLSRRAAGTQKGKWKGVQVSHVEMMVGAKGVVFGILNHLVSSEFDFKTFCNPFCSQSNHMQFINSQL